MNEEVWETVTCPHCDEEFKFINGALKFKHIRDATLHCRHCNQPFRMYVWYIEDDKRCCNEYYFEKSNNKIVLRKKKEV